MSIPRIHDAPEAKPASSRRERSDRAPAGGAAVARLSDHAAHKPAHARRRTLRIEIAPSTIVTIVSIALGIALLTQLVPVILVLITGLMLVGTLSPAVEWLERHKVGRLAAIAIVFAALLVVLGALAVFTVPAFVIQVSSLVAQEPALREKLVRFLAAYPLTTSLAETLRHLQYGKLFKSYSTEAIAFSRSLFELVSYGAGSIFLALYIMIDRDRLRGALFAVVPRAHHMKLSRIMLELETIVGGYVRGQIVTCAMMAIFLFIVLSACGVPNAIAIAAFGGIADVLPFVGIFLTMNFGRAQGERRGCGTVAPETPMPRRRPARGGLRPAVSVSSQRPASPRRRRLLITTLVIIPAKWRYPWQMRGKNHAIGFVRGHGNLALVCRHDLLDHVQA
jgi:hypothetical protein